MLQKVYGVARTRAQPEPDLHSLCTAICGTTEAFVSPSLARERVQVLVNLDRAEYDLPRKSLKDIEDALARWYFGRGWTLFDEETGMLYAVQEISLEGLG